LSDRVELAQTRDITKRGAHGFAASFILFSLNLPNDNSLVSANFQEEEGCDIAELAKINKDGH
jgi:hypothetical protein